MRFALAFFASLLILAPVGQAHADTIRTFNLNAAFANGTATGTVSIDTTTGAFTSENVTYTTTNAGTYVFNQATTPTGSTSGFVYATFSNASTSAYLEINVPSLVGYQGGSVCTLAATCAGGNASNLFETGGYTPNLTSGTLTPVSAATPEPSSLALLGTGVLGVIGAARRRLRKS